MSSQSQEAPVTSFNGRLSKDGSGEFPVEKGRYHLYLTPGCPYAQRVMIMRKLKGLEDVISQDVTHWYIHENGWFFDETEDQCTKDTINGFQFLKEVYDQTNPNYSGRITVPVLYDKVKKVIVNNESAEIMEIFNSDFNEFCTSEAQRELDLFPKEYEEVGDELLSWITPHIIRGVYRCGYSKSQEEYEVAVDDLFEHLDKLEDHLSQRRYLTGNTITHADIKLFVTLARFDIAFYTVHKCNMRRLADYPNIWGYVRDLYQTSGFGETLNVQHIRKLYYLGDRKQKPTGICPRGPIVDFTTSHGREALTSS